MKFVTIDDGSLDGRLHICSRDGRRIVAAEGVKTLQEALGCWAELENRWLNQQEQLETHKSTGTLSKNAAVLSPLPRAWQWLDGSAFETHSLLMQQAWGLPLIGLTERPLMYQGMADKFLPPQGPATFPSAEDGIDYEGEFGIILGAVPMGTKAKDASQYIRLLVLINDWSLRAIGPTEMATGFGWLQCKPACAVAPLSVTPDELGDAWQNHRIGLPLTVKVNGKLMGQANGCEMKFGFDELVEHAAYSRDLPAGTIIGSGTVSNADHANIGSSCLAETRAIEQLANGEATTPFLCHGDRVEMSARGLDGNDVFGSIDQVVRILSD